MEGKRTERESPQSRRDHRSHFCQRTKEQRLEPQTRCCTGQKTLEHPRRAALLYRNQNTPTALLPPSCPPPAPPPPPPPPRPRFFFSFFSAVPTQADPRTSEATQRAREEEVKRWEILTAAELHIFSSFAGLLKRSPFCNHLKHVAFSTPT